MGKKWEGFLNTDFVKGIIISFLLFLIALFVPIAGSIALIFTPLPIVFYYSQVGRVGGTAIAIIALCLISATAVIMNIKINLIVPFVFGFLGLILAEFLKKGCSIEKTLIYPTFSLYLISIAFLLYHCFQWEKQPLDLIESYIAENIQESIRIYTQLKLPSEQVNIIRDNAHPITFFFTNLSPSLVLVGISFTVWLNVLAGKILFKKNRMPYPDFGDLSCWKAPENVVWFVIVAGGIILIPVEEVKYIGLNILIICFFIYLMQGLSIISFFFKRKNIPAILKVAFYFLIFAQQYILLLVIAVGLFDMWINFRRFIKPLNNSSA